MRRKMTDKPRAQHFESVSLPDKHGVLILNNPDDESLKHFLFPCERNHGTFFARLGRSGVTIVWGSFFLNP